MTDALTPVRLATIRNNHARDLRLGEEHLLLADNSDLGDLLGEVDRLTAELAEARKHARIAVAQSVRLATALADIPARLDELANALAVHHRQRQIAIRAMADVVRHRLGSDRDYALADWGAAARDAQDAPQPHPEPPPGAPVMDFPSETPVEPPRPAEGTEPCAHCGKPRNGYGGIDAFAVCHTGTIPAQADPIDCYRLVTVYREPLGARIATDGRLYLDGPPCRHDATWLVATGTGIECMVCGPTTAADTIAPEDEGISTADALAQAANDAEHDRFATRDERCPDDATQLHMVISGYHCPTCKQDYLPQPFTEEQE
jgi:hypothetical protein